MTKKILLVSAVAAALLLTLASSAFAATYISWSTEVNGAGSTPHEGYTASTEKCAVCHSVHTAPGVGTTGTTWISSNPSDAPYAYTWTATGPNTQLLLRSSVSDACTFCHINTAIGGVQLYGGATGVYGTWTGPGHRGSSSSACVNCHAVHGANTLQGGNDTKILRYNAGGRAYIRYPEPELFADITGVPNMGADATRNPQVVAAFADWDTALVSARKYEQQMILCTNCHRVFTTSADTSVGAGQSSTDGSASNWDEAGATKGHPMVKFNSSGFTSATAGIAVTEEDTSGATTDTTVTATGATAMTQVAWANATACRSCHDYGSTNAGTGVVWSSFPHYSRGVPFYLGQGNSLAEYQAAGQPDTTTAGSGVASEPIEPAADGSCLKCHRADATGADGVGGSF